MTSTDTGRGTAAAVLRAVADLIETRPDIPEPGASISFYAHGQNAPAVMAAIVAALPCGWRAKITRSGHNEWLDLTSDIPQVTVTRGTQVTISAPAADACTAAGEKTVTVWQPAAALAGLAGTDPAGPAGAGADRPGPGGGPRAVAAH